MQMHTLTQSLEKQQIFHDYRARKRKSAHTRHGEAKGRVWIQSDSVCAVEVPTKTGMSSGPVCHKHQIQFMDLLMEIREKPPESGLGEWEFVSLCNRWYLPCWKTAAQVTSVWWVQEDCVL